jgi:hypothetical protein
VNFVPFNGVCVDGLCAQTQRDGYTGHLYKELPLHLYLLELQEPLYLCTKRLAILHKQIRYSIKPFLALLTNFPRQQNGTFVKAKPRDTKIGTRTEKSEICSVPNCGTAVGEADLTNDRSIVLLWC